jgi:hypothetical protein
MAWTWDEIEREWLGDSQSPDTPSIVVDAFNQVDAAFGRSWIEATRSSDEMPRQGSLTVLHIIGIARDLAALNGIAGADRLIRKIGQRDRSASSEARAIHLLRSGQPTSQIELEPAIVGSARKPDFRIRRDQADAWVYVEVTRPDTSVETQAFHDTFQRLSQPIETIRRSFALELFLRRPPTDGEVELLADRVEDVAVLDGFHTEELPNDLGRLFLNEHPPGQVVLDDHGEPYRPQLGAARVVASTGEGGEPHRHIAVRIAYTDGRAEAFLRSEARQLSKAAPGLIMIETGDAVGALERWEPVLVGRFRLAQHTRVSAVVLFRSGFLAEDPPRLHVEAKLIRNEFAKHQLPTWIADQVASAS